MPAVGSSTPAFSIGYSPELMDRVRRELEAAFQSYQEGGGILFGHATEEGIHILASRPLPCEHAVGPGFVLTERDEKSMAAVMSAPETDPQLRGLRVLGWYHSHIASPIFLSKRDLGIHARHFPEPFQVALVVRVRAEKEPRAMFFFRAPSGAMRSGPGSEEFTLQAPSEAFEPGPAPAASRPSHPRTLACRQCHGRRLRSSRRKNPLERLARLFGYYPFRCPECLSRAMLKAADFRESGRHVSRQRPVERKRAWLRTRRELLLWSGVVLGFLLVLFYIVRDKPDQP